MYELERHPSGGSMRDICRSCVWVRDSLICMSSWLIDMYEGPLMGAVCMSRSCVWVRDSLIVWVRDSLICISSLSWGLHEGCARDWFMYGVRDSLIWISSWLIDMNEFVTHGYVWVRDSLICMSSWLIDMCKGAAWGICPWLIHVRSSWLIHMIVQRIDTPTATHTRIQHHSCGNFVTHSCKEFVTHSYDCSTNRYTNSTMHTHNINPIWNSWLIHERNLWLIHARSLWRTHMIVHEVHWYVWVRVSFICLTSWQVRDALTWFSNE